MNYKNVKMTRHITKIFQQYAAHPVINILTGKSMEYKDLIKHADKQIQKIWKGSMCNELGRLTQGFKNKVKATNCCEFIFHHDIPNDKRATYACIVAEIRPQKKEET